MNPTGKGMSLPAARRGRRLGAIVLSVSTVVVLAGAANGPDSMPTLPDSTDIAGSVALPAPGEGDLIPAVRQPFKPGESLKFSVQYGLVHAGTAWLEVPEVREWQGHPVYHLLARAESNSFFNHIYKVRNRIESFWDQGGRFSRRYAEDRREGGHRYKDEILFDQGRLEARYGDGASYPIPAGVQDALSAFYYTRYQALPLGGSIVFAYHSSRKSAPLQVRILGRERVDTPVGKFNCVAVEPVLKAGGIFKNSGRLVIWMTDDERRMPVLMRSKLAIGSISVVLVGMKPGA